MAGPGEAEVAQDPRPKKPGLVTRRNLAVVALVVAVLVLARCSGDIAGLFRTGTVNGNEPFHNVSFGSASLPSAMTTLTDAAGKTYKAAGPFVGAVGQGFDQKQLPGMTQSGWFAFDVPVSLTMPMTVNVQSDRRQGTTNPPTLVKFG